jgi:hypothetical protein
MGETLPRPTNRDWVLYDPLNTPPPLSVDLLVVTAGGVLTTGPWRDEYIAWGLRPVLPLSVKERLRGGIHAQ